jgi:hypothetical protein
MGTESSGVAVGKFAGPGAGLDASDFVEDVVTEREIVTAYRPVQGFLKRALSFPFTRSKVLIPEGVEVELATSYCF